MKLNERQLEAVRYLGGPLFVLAGAGSGKTRVITEKIAYMITGAGYAPQHIAAITFTNKAAREMGERVRAILGKEARGRHGALRAEGQCFIRSVGAQREGGWVHLALPGCVAERA